MRVLAPLSLFLGSVALLAPATAQETATSGNKDDEAKEKPKKICRTYRPTGSNLNKRKCRTAEQWLADSERASGAELDVINDGAKTDYVPPM